MQELYAKIIAGKVTGRSFAFNDDGYKNMEVADEWRGFAVTLSLSLSLCVCVCVCVCVRACACVRACVCARARARVRAYSLSASYCDVMPVHTHCVRCTLIFRFTIRCRVGGCRTDRPNSFLNSLRTFSGQYRMPLSVCLCVSVSLPFCLSVSLCLSVLAPLSLRLSLPLRRSSALHLSACLCRCASVLHMCRASRYESDLPAPGKAPPELSEDE